jgi:hypothetical protein
MHNIWSIERRFQILQDSAVPVDRGNGSDWAKEVKGKQRAPRLGVVLERKKEKPIEYPDRSNLA